MDGVRIGVHTFARWNHSDREALLGWCEREGIDPNKARSITIYDRTVVVESYRMNDNGNAVVVNDEVVTDRREVRFSEPPPLPGGGL